MIRLFNLNPLGPRIKRAVTICNCTFIGLPGPITCQRMPMEWTIQGGRPPSAAAPTLGSLFVKESKEICVWMVSDLAVTIFLSLFDHFYTIIRAYHLGVPDIIFISLLEHAIWEYPKPFF